MASFSRTSSGAAGSAQTSSTPAAAPMTQSMCSEEEQLSSWVRKISDAQSKKVTPERKAEILRQCEQSRLRECSKRKAKAFKSHSVRSHALVADGLRQMSKAGGNVREMVAAQQRWSAAQMKSEDVMQAKAARWSPRLSRAVEADDEEEDRAISVASGSDEDEAEENEAMAEVAMINQTEGGAAALAATEGRSDEAFRKLLDQLRKEPRNDEECAAKFGMYETYSSQVEKMRASVFGIYEENKPTLPSMVEKDMAARLKAIDSEEAMGILDETREWFVYHMMRTAEKNNRHMETVLTEFEKRLEFLASHEQAECPVCLESFDEGVPGRAPEVLSCGHRCCKDCWSNWLKVCRGSRPFCPLCRNDEFVADIFARGQ